MSGDPAIVVLAAFADIQSAIRIHGSPNGARITIDCPEVSIEDVNKLLALRGTSFFLAFIPADQQAATSPSPARSRSAWTKE